MIAKGSFHCVYGMIQDQDVLLAVIIAWNFVTITIYRKYYFVAWFNFNTNHR